LKIDDLRNILGGFSINPDPPAILKGEGHLNNRDIEIFLFSQYFSQPPCFGCFLERGK
jgi:hypothetical protein